MPDEGLWLPSGIGEYLLFLRNPASLFHVGVVLVDQKDIVASHRLPDHLKVTTRDMLAVQFWPTNPGIRINQNYMRLKSWA